MPEQAIIYCRFSPRPDADISKSNEKQEERCRLYCEKKGYNVWSAFYDNAVSGKTPSRPGLNSALAFLNRGSVLVVDTWDRLARDMLIQLTICNTVEQLGATIETADGAPNRSTSEGTLFANILAAFAQYERERASRRTKAGLARKKNCGEWLGKTPYGWKVTARKLEKDESEQAGIAHIMILHEQGASSEFIAKILTNWWGLCRGKPWSPRTIRKIIAREKKKEA